MGRGQLHFLVTDRMFWSSGRALAGPPPSWGARAGLPLPSSSQEPPRIQAEPLLGEGGASFPFQALTTLALSKHHGLQEPSNFTFPKLPGFGFQQVLPATTHGEKELAPPGNPLYGSLNKALSPNHLAYLPPQPHEGRFVS